LCSLQQVLHLLWKSCLSSDDGCGFLASDYFCEEIEKLVKA
jgi:hypothetical protein